LSVSSNRGRGEGGWFLILSQTECTWLSLVPETQLGRAAQETAVSPPTQPGPRQDWQRHKGPRLGSCRDTSQTRLAGNGRKGPRLPNTHTCTPPLTPSLSEPPQNAARDRQTPTVIKIRPERDKATEINKFGNKAKCGCYTEATSWFDTAHLPNKRARKPSGTSGQVRGILPAELSRGLSAARHVPLPESAGGTCPTSAPRWGARAARAARQLLSSGNQIKLNLPCSRATADNRPFRPKRRLWQELGRGTAGSAR